MGMVALPSIPATDKSEAGGSQTQKPASATYEALSNSATPITNENGDRLGM